MSRRTRSFFGCDGVDEEVGHAANVVNAADAIDVAESMNKPSQSRDCRVSDVEVAK